MKVVPDVDISSNYWRLCSMESDSW